MIVVEEFTLPGSEDVLTRTYSDAGYMIIQDGTGDLYGEAIDPKWTGRTYTESDIKIDRPEEEFDECEDVEEDLEPDEG